MTLSGGQRRKLSVAIALIGDAKVIMLDEPTSGMDTSTRRRFWEMVKQYKQDRIVILTTHYMDEAQRLCDRLVIIDHGQILAEGSPQYLIDKHVKGHVFELQKTAEGALDLSRFEHEDIGDSVLIYVHHPDEFTQIAPTEAHYLHRQANLEDVFLRLTGRALREN